MGESGCNHGRTVAWGSGEYTIHAGLLTYLLGGRIHNMVNGLHGEIEGHELHDGAEALVGSPCCETCEAHFWVTPKQQYN